MSVRMSRFSHARRVRVKREMRRRIREARRRVPAVDSPKVRGKVSPTLPSRMRFTVHRSRRVAGHVAHRRVLAWCAPARGLLLLRCLEILHRKRSRTSLRRARKALPCLPAVVRARLVRGKLARAGRLHGLLHGPVHLASARLGVSHELGICHARLVARRASRRAESVRPGPRGELRRCVPRVRRRMPHVRRHVAPPWAHPAHAHARELQRARVPRARVHSVHAPLPPPCCAPDQACVQFEFGLPQKTKWPPTPLYAGVERG